MGGAPTAPVQDKDEVPGPDVPTPQAPADNQCPICQFIEAGACKEQHQVWSACREEAKKNGVDYVDACQEQFKAFLQCTVENSDYYEPFLSMLLGEEEDEEAAAAKPAADSKAAS